MQVLRGLKALPPALRGAVLAIGNFDGVHRGHQAVLGAAKAADDRAGRPAGLMVFEPHPREVFQPDKPLFRLTPLERKLELIAMLGHEFAVVIDFDRDFSAQSPKTFASDVLLDRLEVSHVVTGYDFFFGRGREGSPEALRALGAELGFAVTIVTPEGDKGEVFSSTRVRELLAEGHVRDAAEMLGHWWRVRGTVVGGAKRGTGLGYPTANIHLAPGVQLHHGIYAVRVHEGSSWHAGAAYLGTRPTFDDGAPVLEVFLIHYDGNLYGRQIDIEFIAFLRRDAKFVSMEALKAQMDKDCTAAMAALDAVAAHDPMAAYPIGRAIAASAGSQSR
jgi:riboflavin kinase / FMN adenylyltransferase